MKAILAVSFMLLLAAPPILATRHNNHSHSVSLSWCDDTKSMEFHKGSLIIKQKGNRPNKIEITKSYQLFVDGDLVKTNAEQQQLVEEYYDLAVGSNRRS